MSTDNTDNVGNTQHVDNTTAESDVEVTPEGEMSVEDIVATMDAMINNSHSEVKITADNIEEVLQEVAESSEDSKLENNKIDVTETETDTTTDGSKEDIVNVHSTKEDVDPSGDVETGTEFEVDDTVPSQNDDTDPEGVSDDGTDGEGLTNPTDVHYKRLLATLSQEAGTEVSELTPDMLASMYRSAKGLTSNSVQKPEEAMLEKHNFTIEDLSLMAELKSGNVDAIKKFMVDKEINPFEVDLEEFDKEAFEDKLSSNAVNPIELQLNGLVERADATGVKDVVVNKVLAWDESSVLELLDDAETSNVLLGQIRDGSFDAIMKEVERRDALDFTDSSDKTMMDKYSEASHALAARKARELNSNIVPPVAGDKTSKTDTTKSKTKGKTATKQVTPKEEDNKSTPATPNKQEVKQDVDNEARKKAAKAASTASTNITAPSTSANGGTGVKDINKMSDEELYAFMENMIQ